MSTVNWELTLSELVKLVEDTFAKYVETIKSCPDIESRPADDLNLLLNYQYAIRDITSISLIFLTGFDEIARGGELSNSVTPNVREWVQNVPRQRSGTRLAGMVAVSLGSILEEFIVQIGAAKITPEVETRLRTTKDKLLNRVKPSVKADGKEWLKALTDVFSITLESVGQDSLISMIQFRNHYVHEPAAIQTIVTGEEIECWIQATMLLALRIAIAV